MSRSFFDSLPYNPLIVFVCLYWVWILYSASSESSCCSLLKTKFSSDSWLSDCLMVSSGGNTSTPQCSKEAFQAVRRSHGSSEKLRTTVWCCGRAWQTHVAHCLTSWSCTHLIEPMIFPESLRRASNIWLIWPGDGNHHKLPTLWSLLTYRLKSTEATANHHSGAWWWNEARTLCPWCRRKVEQWTDCVCLSVRMFGRSCKTLTGRTLKDSSKCESHGTLLCVCWSPSLIWGKGELGRTGLLRSSKCIIVYGKLCKLELPLKSFMYVTIWSLPPFSPLSLKLVFLFGFWTDTTFIHECSPLRRVPGFTHHSAERCRRWRWWKD